MENHTTSTSSADTLTVKDINKAVERGREVGRKDLRTEIKEIIWKSMKDETNSAFIAIAWDDWKKIVKVLNK